MLATIARATALTLTLTAATFAQKPSDSLASKPQVHLDLGLFTDFYGDKVVIEFIDRVRYPSTDFPFQAGDELVSIGGQSVVELMVNSETVYAGSAAYRQRLAADALTYRPQTPLANPAADVVVRRASTNGLEFYHLAWVPTGSGFAVDQKAKGAPPIADTPDLKYLDERQLQDEHRQWISRNDILGWGRVTPYFSMPANFQPRLGGDGRNRLFSGSFEAAGKQIGYVRIPNLSAVDFDEELSRLDAELDFFRQNTEGLIVDLSRNVGGSCSVSTLAQRLLSRTGGGYTLTRISSTAPTHGHCASVLSTPGHRQLTNPPDPYTKPAIFLADELSIGSSETFLALMQDNGRGPVVGTATAGLAGVAQALITVPSVVPDVEVNFMTRENLLTRGTDFMNAITTVILNEIGKAQDIP